MIIVDRALQDRAASASPVRVGMVGAGAMGAGIALQIVSAVPGMDLVAISNRHPERAEQAYAQAGIDHVQHVSTVPALDAAIAGRRPAVTDDPTVLCAAAEIDVILEVTGSIDFGAEVVLDAIEQGKHVVTMNAELQGTVGPVLKTYADRAGVVFSDSDGDQPGVIMNLYRFVEGIGCRPVLAGNLKGLHDPYRNPTTQEGFARRNGLAAHMATSFADGTKVSFEMAIVANATGLQVGQRGMYGPDCGHVQDAAALFPLDQMLDRGLVDYVVGAEPAPGVFVLGHQEHPVQRRYLDLYKLGKGPIYTFYTPYHLCHLEAPQSLARAVLFGDPVVSPRAGPVVEVVAAAKRDLHAGEVLDGIGWYMTYGLCENAATTAADDLLPMGVAEGARLVADVPQDRVLRNADVELPPGRTRDRLRAEQAALWRSPPVDAKPAAGAER